jgi:hypothetical protein
VRKRHAAAALEGGKPVRRRQVSRWRAAFYAGLAVSALAVVGNLVLDRFDATTYWGMGYGFAAAGLMLLCALYAARRRTMARGWGTARSWQQLHLYAGGLFFILVVLHMGFKWPQGSLNQWLFGLSAWITATGLAGVAIQYWIPRLLTAGVATEVVYERIPELVETLRGRAEEAAAAAPDPVRDLYRREIEPAMAGPVADPRYLLEVRGRIAARTRSCAFVRGFLAGEERDALDRLETAYRTKLEVDAQYTLQRVLRGWLWTHVPPSIALVVLVAYHIVVVFRY